MTEMLNMAPPPHPLQKGAFVRVRADSACRAGQDGMVAAVGANAVGLLFGYDRFNRSPTETGIVTTGLVEEWALDELDLDSIEH